MVDLTEKSLERAKKYLKEASDSLTKEDFLKAFENVVKIVTQIGTKLLTEGNQMKSDFSTLALKLQNDNSSDLEQIKTEAGIALGNALNAIKESYESRIKAMENKVALLVDGEDADEEAIYARLLAQIPTIEDIIKNIPISGPQIRDALELLQDDERLDVSAIKGLDEYIGKRVPKDTGKQIIAAGGRPRLHYFDLSAQCNGTLKVFAVPLNFGIVGVFSSQAPLIFRPMIDWTEGNRTLTLTNQVDAPQTGQTLWIQYLK